MELSFLSYSIREGDPVSFQNRRGQENDNSAGARGIVRETGKKFTSVNFSVVYSLFIT